LETLISSKTLLALQALPPTPDTIVDITRINYPGIMISSKVTIHDIHTTYRIMGLLYHKQ
jgi:hypothetical protein